jgi:type IV secretory pathway TrbD component
VSGDRGRIGVARRRATRVHAALLEPQLVAGVERPLAILNATVCGVFVLDLHVWCYLPVAMGIHWLLRRATRQDPFMRPIYARYVRQADAYDPWPHAVSARGSNRPRPVGRGLLC